MIDIVAFVNRVFDSNNLDVLKLILSPHANFAREYDRITFKILKLQEHFYFTRVRFAIYNAIKADGVNALDRVIADELSETRREIKSKVNDSQDGWFGKEKKQLCSDQDRAAYVEYRMQKIKAFALGVVAKLEAENLNRRAHKLFDTTQYEQEMDAILAEEAEIQTKILQEIDSELTGLHVWRTTTFERLYEAHDLDGLFRPYIPDYKEKFLADKEKYPDVNEEEYIKEKTKGEVDNLISFLSSYNFPIDTKLNENGLTLLYKALQRRDHKLVELLLLKGASLTAPITVQDKTYPLFQHHFESNRNLFVYAVENGFTLLAVKFISLLAQDLENKNKKYFRSCLNDCTDNDSNTLMHQVFSLLNKLAYQHQDYLNHSSPASSSESKVDNMEYDSEGFVLVLSYFRFDKLLEQTMKEICRVAVDCAKLLDVHYFRENMNERGQTVGQLLSDFERHYDNQVNLLGEVFIALKLTILTSHVEIPFLKIQETRSQENISAAIFTDIVNRLEGNVEDPNRNFYNDMKALGLQPSADSSEHVKKLVEQYEPQEPQSTCKMTALGAIAVDALFDIAVPANVAVPAQDSSLMVLQRRKYGRIINFFNEEQYQLRNVFLLNFMMKVYEAALMGNDSVLIKFLSEEKDGEGKVLRCVPIGVVREGRAGMKKFNNVLVQRLNLFLQLGQLGQSRSRFFRRVASDVDSSVNETDGLREQFSMPVSPGSQEENQDGENNMFEEEGDAFVDISLDSGSDGENNRAVVSGVLESVSAAQLIECMSPEKREEMIRRLSGESPQLDPNGASAPRSSDNRSQNNNEKNNDEDNSREVLSSSHNNDKEYEPDDVFRFELR